MTAEHVKDACFSVVYDKCPVLACIGPIENMTDYNMMRSQMYWFRV